MQVARNALALGDLGQVLDFFVGFAQFAIHAIALGKECIPRANNHGKETGVEKLPAANVQQNPFNRSDGANRGQTEEGSHLTIHAERKHGCREDEERAGTRINGLEQQAKEQHPADVGDRPRILQDEQTEIKTKEYNGASNVEEPQPEAGVAEHRIYEKEAQIEYPKQRTPSVIFVPEYGPPGLELQRTCGAASVAKFKIHSWHLGLSPDRQFRPLRRAVPVPYHTSIAAGIKPTNHFSPPNRARKPKRIKTVVPPIDFFELALMVRSSMLPCAAGRI